MTDNVILFPRRKNGPPETMEEIIETVTNNRIEQIGLLMGEMVYNMIELFESNGIMIDQEEYMKDVAMIVESMKSALHKYFGVTHPFHDLVDTIFEVKVREDGPVEYSYDLSKKEDE